MNNKFLTTTIFTLSFLLIITNIVNCFVKNLSQKENINYITALYENNDLEIEYPNFDNKAINNKIKEIITSFNIKEGVITYEASIVNNKYLSIVFNLPNYNYKSYLIDLNSTDELNIKRIINDTDILNNKINEMLNLKYSKFIIDGVKDQEESYLIKENEMYVYFSNNITPKINEPIYIILNYHEIYNYLKINYTLDLEYKNENIYKLNSNKKTIAITFDDGPSYTTTLEIVNILKDNKATATFFMLGNKMLEHKLIINKVLANGNEIGSHSYSHKYLTRIKKEAMLNEINLPNEIYKNITGLDIKLFRVPYGSINEKVRNSINMPIIRWNIDSLDWENRNAKAIKDNVLKNVKDGDIILLHDVFKTTVEGVRILLPELYAQGYQVVSVSKLAELKNKTLENNKVYTYILKAE